MVKVGQTQSSCFSNEGLQMVVLKDSDLHPPDKIIKMWCRSVELCFEKREIDALLNVIMWSKLCGL